MNEFVSSILDLSGAREAWRPISRWAVGAWLAFYLLFLVYAFQMHGGYLFIDSANLVVHEGGHLLFGWFGSTLGLWGGTILQWMVPLLLAAYFFHQRQPASFVFCAFFFFENWLYTATYMADARYDFAARYHRRPRVRPARLERNFFQLRPSGVRHHHRRHCENRWLVRNAGLPRLASCARNARHA
jgi:hypothetical protein